MADVTDALLQSVTSFTSTFSAEGHTDKANKQASPKASNVRLYLPPSLPTLHSGSNASSWSSPSASDGSFNFPQVREPRFDERVLDGISASASRTSNPARQGNQLDMQRQRLQLFHESN